MKCIVLAAGYATRLYPLTENFPKPLLEVGDKVLLDWLFDDIDKEKRISEYIVISNHKYYDKFNNWAKSKKLLAPITVIDDGTNSNEERLGAVKDIELAINKLKINEDVMVIAGDNLLDFSLGVFFDYYDKKKNTCIMRYFENDREKLKKSGGVDIDENDQVLNMIEKPPEPIYNWCSPPFYIYSKEAVNMVSEAIKNGCAKDSPGSYIAYLYDKIPIYAMEMPGKRYDIGNIDSYNKVIEKFSKK